MARDEAEELERSGGFEARHSATDQVHRGRAMGWDRERRMIRRAAADTLISGSGTRARMTRSQLRRAVVMREVLGPPRAFRPYRPHRYR